MKSQGGRKLLSQNNTRAARFAGWTGMSALRRQCQDAPWMPARKWCLVSQSQYNLFLLQSETKKPASKCSPASVFVSDACDYSFLTWRKPALVEGTVTVVVVELPPDAAIPVTKSLKALDRLEVCRIV